MTALSKTRATTEVSWRKFNPSFWNPFQTSMNVLPSTTQQRRTPSPRASTYVTTTLVASSAPATQAMSFRQMGIPAMVN